MRGKTKFANCKHMTYEGDYMVCDNDDSEYFADYIEPNHVCIDFEGEWDE